MTSKPEDIRSKAPLKKITKCEGVINYKIIRKIYRKIQANASTIQSELGGGQHGLLGMEMQPATYKNVIGKDFQRLVHPPQASPVPTNADAAEIPRYIQLHAAQVDQWHQMINAEDILKQKLLGSLDEKYFTGQRQAYINYANRTLAVLIQHLYDDHGTISPMDIEESEQKMKQEWSLLDPIVELFEQIEEGVEFAEGANTPIPGGKVVNIAYLLILRTGEMEKACEKWEDMQVGLKTWQAFKDHFAQV